MTNETNKINQLLKDKKITQEEYNLLINSLNKKESHLLKIFNPYQYINESIALSVGVLTIIVTTFLAPFVNITFSGLLDLQTSKETVYWQAVQRTALQNIMIILLWAISTWCTTLLLKQKNLRFIDFLIGSLLPRIPYLIVVLLYLVFFSITGIDPQLKEVHGPMILIIALLTIPGLILNLVYLFLGFEYASGLQGKKLWISYISLIFIIETITVILSRTLLS